MGSNRPGSACAQLLVSYRSRLHHACYVTRMDKDNIPGLDAATQAFQRWQVSSGGAGTGFGGAQEPLWGRRSLPGDTGASQGGEEWRRGRSAVPRCPAFLPQAEQRLAMPLDDRSLLGTTASILCSIVPVYWI